MKRILFLVVVPLFIGCGSSAPTETIDSDQITDQNNLDSVDAYTMERLGLSSLELPSDDKESLYTSCVQPKKDEAQTIRDNTCYWDCFLFLSRVYRHDPTENDPDDHAKAVCESKCESEYQKNLDSVEKSFSDAYSAMLLQLRTCLIQVTNDDEGREAEAVKVWLCYDRFQDSVKDEFQKTVILSTNY
jgi:hypothetical protein